MANEQNLIPFDSESAKIAQPKAVKSRYKNKLIREAIASEIWAYFEENPDKLREVARGLADRSAENSGDLSVMADIIDGKQKDTVAVENEHIIVRRHRNDD